MNNQLKENYCKLQESFETILIITQQQLCYLNFMNLEENQDLFDPKK
ncbi:MAG: hypothetical protein BAJALOKI1v1_1570008 [Promethearchaeota archaeon]|nr:MAG: hypothetical protein BAJALOKI1v1_1570008 [Candidatus Lokiarchaeota archaeon]